VNGNLAERVTLSLIGLLFLAGISGCDYQRMKDQASVRTYKKEMPEMDTRTIPVKEGFQILANADARKLTNPLPQTPGSIKQGKESYGYYCVQCHGPKGDGEGTVGQSFSPLPADLRSDGVQVQSDGELYAKIRLGYKRHPRLYTTISQADTWAVVDYMRSLKQ
jgi:mono/diheme cytochrome c family protein